METQHDVTFLCPQCSGALVEQDGEFWCDLNKRAFPRVEVIENQKWRRFGPSKKVTLFQELGQDGVAQRYYLQPEQIREVADLANEADNAKDAVRESVAPQKRALLSLALSITDDAALCEFIDNARDAGVRRRPGQLVSVSINFNRALQALEISDDAGGMDLSDLLRCLTLGSKPLDSDESIGRYGIGAKEAIYHFGKEVTIRTRLANAESGLRTIVGADWLDSPDWNVTVEHLDTIKPCTTSIKVGQLRRLPDDSDLERLHRHLWETYERSIHNRTLELRLNEELLQRESEYEMLFPPELYPRDYMIKCGRLSIDMRVMLIKGSPEMSGLWMYAQGRRFLHLRWADARVSQVLGKPRQHNLTSHIRVELAFRGPISDIPISSNKHNIQNNGVLQLLRPVIKSLTEPYFTSVNPLSRGGMGLISDFTIKSAHELARTEIPVFDLGRIEGSVAIPSNIKADSSQFACWVDATIGKSNTDATDMMTPLVPIRLPNGGSSLASGDQPAAGAGGVLVKERSNENTRTEYTLRLQLADAPLKHLDSARKQQIQNWLRDGRLLGIEISDEWTPV